MRVNKWGIGVVLTAAVLLTGCTGTGADDKADDTKSGSSSEESSAPASDCPELSEGADVDMTALSKCMTESMADTEGYAASISTMGVESTIRYNGDDKATEMESTFGSMIIIGDDIWVKTASGDWQVGDPDSDDPMVASLSQSAEAATGAGTLGGMTTVDGEFTVTGTSERLGEKVYLVSGTTEQAGMEIDAVFEVTEDYVALASTTSGETAGQEVEVTFEITEWDEKQEIVAPM